MKRETCRRVGVAFGLFLLATWMLVPALAAGENATNEQVVEFSLEELMDVEVYSVSKKKEKASNAPAALYILTQEDIRRSGANSVPELLRMVPGVQVARINANQWAISIRGFSGWFSNKLLVLIDGRSVYNTVFSGVYWNSHDLVLEDIERIEVIRGSGGTLWGANAVNGVINIISKSAKDTTGSLLVAGGGTEELGFTSIRHGTAVGDSGHVRVYGKYYSRDASQNLNGEDSYDEADAFHGGFRSDWTLSQTDSLVFQGGLHTGNEQLEVSKPSLEPPFERLSRGNTDDSGGNILARWQHGFSDTSDGHLQLFYTREDRKDVLSDQSIDTYDLELQHRFQANANHQLVWGLGYRAVVDSLHGTDSTSIDPNSRTASLVQGFLQDEITLIADRLRLIVGSKLEHNDYTGFEVQPNARLIWTPSDTQTIWASYSRAVRTPSRIEEDSSIDFAVVPLPGGTGTTLVRVIGQSGIQSEVLNGFELGYRLKGGESFYADLAGFYYNYDELASFRQGQSFIETDSGSPLLVTPALYANGADGESVGFELSLNFKASKIWTLQGNYTFLERTLDLDSEVDLPRFNEEGRDPENQLSFRSLLDLPCGFEFDAFLRYVDSLPVTMTEFRRPVGSYFELDLRLGWQASDNVLVEVVGHDLLEDQHAEFFEANPGPVPSELERGVYGRLKITF